MQAKDLGLQTHLGQVSGGNILQCPKSAGLVHRLQRRYKSAMLRIARSGWPSPLSLRYHVPRRGLCQGGPKHGGPKR